MMISATVITFNEERNIERCLKSLGGLVDEIVVIDSFSTDRTQEICESFKGVRFIKNTFEGHIQQKNFAISQTSQDYILSLDADEAISSELRDSILAIKDTLGDYDGYNFNRRNWYIDRWIYHCGWYPDRKLRIFHKDKAKWGGVNPHDIIEMSPNSRTKFLDGDLLHYTYFSIEEHIVQQDKFSTIAAKAYFDRGKKSTMLQVITRPALVFLRDYFLRAGFLDGSRGFMVCYINGLYAFLKYAKLRDFWLKKKS
ncbi:glycosyltransferase family 2 protein [Halobacteriovorax sp. RZ-3]|uniref:glycosyltransferase family 2 protein n=1 Tax=Halobacteriovorax sp. RZ-3 TaxID=3157720 RepID=UPI00371F2EEC